MSQDVAAMLQAADAAAAAGREPEARRLWESVLGAEPENPRALFRLGERALRDRQPERALPLFQRAAAAKPDEARIPFHAALAFRALGNADGEMAALNRSLALDPHFLLAVLAKAELLHRTGRIRQAARIYQRAIELAAFASSIPAELTGALARARKVVDDNANALDAFLAKRTAPARAQHQGAKLTRFDECVDVMLGRKKIYPSQCEIMQFPQLPAIGFHEREPFPWLSRLEAATELIQSELVAALSDQADFTPYVKLPVTEPLNQWAELNNSPRWSSYYLWQDGVRIDAHCARCPNTAALLDTLPLAVIPGFGPNAFFSAVAPHTKLPAHNGSTNVRLTVHLPLLLPGRCGFRVGSETREWRIGDAWVFDDTIEHEAWNDSDKLRVILIFDTWNPALSLAERDLVGAMLKGYQDYYRGH